MSGDLERILNALNFAAAKHKDQRRKGAGKIPYINHPIEVANLLVRVGGVADTDMIVAAILHDTLEDTDTSPEELRTVFGERVLSLVKECTDDKSLPKAERKRLQIQNAPHKTDEAKQIKIADKISNVISMGATPPDEWSHERRIEYLDWSEKVVKGLVGVNKALDDYYFEALEKARQQLSR